MGIRVLTDIVELELHDDRLLRIAAHRLNQIGERELAIDLFEKVLKLRPSEKREALTLRLKDVKEVVGIGTVTLGGQQKVEATTQSAELNK
jgi:hypothetical protein